MDIDEFWHTEIFNKDVRKGNVQRIAEALDNSRLGWLNLVLNCRLHVVKRERDMHILLQ